MPLYEYRCEGCGHRVEVIQKFSDPAPAACPACGKGPLIRQLSSPAIQFKGSGWYITDYARKGSSESGKTDTIGESKTGGSSASETAAKPDAGSKTESAPPASASPPDSKT